MELESTPVSASRNHTDNIKNKSSHASYFYKLMSALDKLKQPALFKHSQITRFNMQANLRMMLMALGIALLALAGLSWLNSQQSDYASAQTQIAGHALMHSQRIGKAAPNAIQGNPGAFVQLRESRTAMNDNLQLLANGGAAQGRNIPGPDQQAAQSLADIRKTWQNSDKSAARILSMEKELTGFRSILQTLNNLSPRLLEISEQIASLSAQTGATPREISAAGQLVMLTQRLGKSANEFLTSEGVNPATAFQLGKDANAFHDIVAGLTEGSAVLRLPAASNPDVRQKLAELAQAFSE